MPKLNVQQNNQNIIQAFKNALAIGRLKGIIASDGNHNFSTSGTNPNLLDNAYFVGGGSQLGDGHFPINQRGQTQYTAAGFVFDRWFKSGGVTATLDAGGLTIVNSNGWPDGINQRFPMHFFAQMNGQAITASVLYADGSVDSGTAVIDATQNYQWLKYPEAGEIGFQLKNFQDGAAYDYFDYISFGAGTNSTPKKIKAVKLERGTVSTLPNDPPPDFGEEQRKCQRYLYIPTFPWYAWTGTVAMATSATDFNWVINTPVPMRQGAIPTIGITGSVYINGTAASNLSIVNAPVGNLVKISGTSAGMTNGQLYPVNTSANNVSVILSAEL